MRRSRSSSAGFTLMELMVVVAILLIFSLVGFPAFKLWIERARLVSVARSTAMRMKVAQQESIKMNLTAVAQPDFDNDEIVYFVNVDGDPNFEFNPDSTAPFKTVDYELSRQQLPTEYDIVFWAPTDAGPEGRDAVDGFTATNAPQNAAVFRPDGSVEDVGAIRFADNRANYLEVRVAPKAGRIQVLKYHDNPPWGDPSGFYPRGQHPTSGEPLWYWN